MKIGFLVSSVSREAGGLFQSVHGLAKAVASTNANVRVFGMSDEQSAVDLQEWRPLSVQTFGPQLRAWSYSTELVPAIVGADLDVLSVHGLWKYSSVGSQRWHQRTGRAYVIHPHGMLEPWALRNARWKKRIAALLYENQHLRGAACLRALSEAEAKSIRVYGLRNPICVIPNGVDLPDVSESSTLKSRSDGRKILPRPTSPKEKRGESDPRVERHVQFSALQDRQLGPCNRWMGSGRIRKRTQTCRNCSFGRFPRPAVRRGERRMLSRVRRIHPAFAERRSTDDCAGGMGVCKTGGDDT